MAFENIIGQKRVKELLFRGYKNNRLSHAFLFTGQKGVGKEAMALELAKMIFCKDKDNAPCGTCDSCVKISHLSHPDLSFLFPAMKSTTPENERSVLDSVAENPYYRSEPWASPSISIAKIRELRRASAIKPLEGRGRVVIIAEVEKMTVEASNALLKLLEEPSKDMTLILTTTNSARLLPTIISRCQEIKFVALSDAEIETALIQRMQVDEDKARLLSRISLGSFRRAVEWLDGQILSLRTTVVDVLRDILLRGDLATLQLVDRLSRDRDKKLTKELLMLILIWLRDVMLLQLKADEDGQLLINIDQKALLQKFESAFSEINFDRAIHEVEEAIVNIDRNIQLNLILLVLFFHLKKYFKRTSG